jgi:hypothetical protein
MIRLLVTAGLCLISNICVACDLAGSETVELEAGVTLHYRIVPSQLRVAQHFSMRFLVCRGKMPQVPDNFKVDALMPTHVHGMNYKAIIEIQPDGQVEATGMMFHMPGPWQVRVDLSSDGLDRQLSHSFPLIPGAVRLDASVFGLRETSDRNPR